MSEPGPAQKGAAQKPAGPDPLLGRVIAGRFKITSLIARGGMGKVYRAEQSPLGRLCAVKVLNPNYNGDADPEFHRRFFREASITSRITHPNSVTIFDYGKTEDDIYFMAMEYLEGQTLHMALRDGGVMHEVRAGRIASQICRALREAHKLGVIHRDLKPANIFLTRPNTRARGPDGTLPPAEEDEDFVKVLDFGLVKHLSEKPEEQLTQTGLFMGSPKYMAPEQIQGGHVDERTDIYSLGIIMYEMLAGKVPFERASSVNILMAHVGEPPPPMREVNPNLVCSPAFEEIVMRCIAKEPSQRLSSMDDLLQAIRRAHGGTLTGQLNAISGTGPFLPTRGSVPPPYPYTPPGGAHSASMQAARALTPHGTGPVIPPAAATARMLPLGDAANDVASREREVTATGAGTTTSSFAASPKPPSKAWVILGVFAAAAVGGALGMVAFRWTSPTSTTPASSTPEPSASAPTSEKSAGAPGSEPAPSAAVSSAPSSEPSAPTTSSSSPPTPAVKVITEPGGASVRENDKELCAATLCDVVLKGDAGKPHKVVISRAGFRTETRTLKSGDAPLHVKLTHAPAVVRPRSEPTAPPSGFKDQPY